MWPRGEEPIMRLAGKTAYVTGASSGIGKGAAIRLGHEGAKVVLIGRRQVLLDEAAAQCSSDSVGVALDVTDGAAVLAVLAAAIAEHGAPDIVVHAAGETVLGSLDALTEAEWDQQFNTNLKSIYFVNKVLWPAMTAHGGSIVTIASTASFAAFPGDAAYVASKGAVLALTKAMALDGAPFGIRVNAVCPGFILTPNLQGYFDGQADPTAAANGAAAAAPLGRMGMPDDVAGAVAFFASDDSAFVTGASLLVDGGLMAQV
jgi:NAD(P)-dependent dehydrogenase (short-subunit alcohol dehydrogenase family)